jgi:hypothetical protein
MAEGLMGRFVIERHLGDVADEDLEKAAGALQQAREERFPDVTWSHSHVVRDGSGLIALCVYEAPDAQRLRDHSAAAGVPADRVLEIHTDLFPDPGR